MELIQDFFVRDKLKEQFIQVFSDIDAKQMAEQKLFYLKQTKLAAAYMAEFQQIAAKTEWEDKAFTAKYYKGLKNFIKDRIVETDWPEELDKIIEKLIIIDNCQYKCRLERKGKPSQ